MALLSTSNPSVGKSKTLWIIVFAQFLGTSLWFAGNAVITDIVQGFQNVTQIIGHSSSAVQLGFVVGTWIVAIFKLADRHSSTDVFMWSCCFGSAFNVLLLIPDLNLLSILGARFFTGFALAGIYPVGIRIVADESKTGLGSAMGYLVGALVLGTAAPHLLKAIGVQWPWQFVIIATSFFAMIGGIMVKLLVLPSTKNTSPAPFSLHGIGFADRQFRNAALGYFGHMWELYAFWAFVPLLISSYVEYHHMAAVNVSFLSFLVLFVGSISCVLGGYLSLRRGAKTVAYSSLLVSCFCCCVVALIFLQNSFFLFYAFLLVWGFFVIPDSPQFATIVAQTAQAESKGSAIVFVNCVGFFVTFLCIELVSFLNHWKEIQYVMMILAIGPLLALWANARKRQ